MRKRFQNVAAGFLFLLIIGMVSPCVTMAADAVNFEGIYSGDYNGADQGRWGIEYLANGTCLVGFWSNTLKRGDYFEVSADVIGDTSSFMQVFEDGSYLYFEFKTDGRVAGLGGYVEQEDPIVFATGNKNNMSAIQAFIGKYHGEFKGGDKGVIDFSISDFPFSCAGAATSYKTHESGFVTGFITDSGEIFAHTLPIGSVIYGKANSNGKVTGEWHNYLDGTSGTLSAAKEGTSDGGGGGGGGCFIESITSK